MKLLDYKATVLISVTLKVFKLECIIIKYLHDIIINTNE